MSSSAIPIPLRCMGKAAFDMNTVTYGMGNALSLWMLAPALLIVLVIQIPAQGKYAFGKTKLALGKM